MTNLKLIDERINKLQVPWLEFFYFVNFSLLIFLGNNIYFRPIVSRFAIFFYHSNFNKLPLETNSPPKFF